MEKARHVCIVLMVGLGCVGLGTAAAAPIRLSIGGQQQVFFGVGALQDDTPGLTWSNTGMTTDTKINFFGTTTLDNGLKVAAIINLWAEASAGNANAEEQAIQVSGGFGTLQAGQRDGLAALMAYTGPEAGGVIESEEFWDYIGWMNYHPNYFDGDHLGLSYLSPWFRGFSFAVDYAPSGQTSGDVGPLDWADITQVAISYDNDFGDIALHGDIAYAYADGVNATKENADLNFFRAGAAITYQGIEVGGSYGYWARDGFGNDDQNWKVGIGYTTGPYGVAAHYTNSYRNNSSRIHVGQITGNYILAPGIDLGAAVFYANQDGTGPTFDASVPGAIFGIGLKF